MKNSNNIFELVDARLHMNDRHIFIVKGIYSKNIAGENRISAFIDGEELKGEEQIKEGVEVQRRYAWYPHPINTEYSYLFDLPQDIEKKKRLKVFEEAEGKKKEIYSASVEKVLEAGKRLIYSIDSVGGRRGGIEIKGWFIGDDKVSINVQNANKELIETKITFGYRRDVVENFSEVNPEIVKGFKIMFKKPQQKRVKVNFTYNGSTETQTIPTTPSKLRSVNKKMCSYLKKGWAYYRRHGVRLTLNRVEEKLFERDTFNYEKWLDNHSPNDLYLSRQRKRKFEREPKISIVVPLYKTPKKYLTAMVESVKKQTYKNWELCLSDGSGENSPIESLLRELEQSDQRIKVVYNKEQLKISDNTNRAIEAATGEFIGFADHDDLLTPNALYECVKILNRHPKVQAIYSDEDKVTMDGKKHFQPHFKPDYNEDLLNSTNYFCHFFMVQRTVIDKIGMLNSEFDGAQDYDFVLRCSEVVKNIYHIPKILYHWRAHEDSTAENPESKMYAFEAGARAIQAHYDRIGWKNTKVTQTQCLGVYRTHYTLDTLPLVSIIIPNKDHIDDLKTCLKSIERCTYQNYEIIIVENNSVEKETFQFYHTLEKDNEKLKVVYWEGIFNYSAINNFGVKHAEGRYLLFLNNDTEIINKDCIEEMLGFCMREDVGAVGARLYYSDGTIQHAGVIVGLGGIAGHIFLNTPSDQVGYFARVITQQDYSAVTAACIMVKKDVFEDLQGFDEKLVVAFNDVDLCLRIRELGKKIVYNPYAELYHYESKSRGQDDTPDKIERFNRETAYFEDRWEKILAKGDPYYNKNFAIDRFDCSLC
ncbi:glycosyltransferase family 2 protein [Sporofaciens musculi]|uniref:glycosyltransferase family 2 protein n=1 Tax=Sporofaciens musculi TaxID=2681861 RepID=UPI0025A1ED1C|nr:glycosyltransferase family 2 protein [Sporofaciens musculi]